MNDDDLIRFMAWLHRNDPPKQTAADYEAERQAAEALWQAELEAQALDLNDSEVKARLEREASEAFHRRADYALLMAESGVNVPIDVMVPTVLDANVQGPILEGDE